MGDPRKLSVNLPFHVHITILKWSCLCSQTKPAVYVTYNGDFFDWPFMETRSEKLGMDMHKEIGFKMDKQSNECLSRYQSSLCHELTTPGLLSFRRLSPSSVKHIPIRSSL